MRRIVLAAVGASLLLPAAVHAVPPPGHHPKLTLAATPTRMTFGGSTTLAGKLTGARSSAPETVVVEADAYPLDGHYVDVATTATDANGDWRVTQAPEALTRYRARAQTSPPATSATADVGVRLRVRVHASDRTPSRGERVRFHGTVAPAHDGKPVKVQRRTATGHWHTVARTVMRHTDHGVSSYSKRVRVRRSGTYRVRALPQDADHLRGTSHRRRLTVTG